MCLNYHDVFLVDVAVVCVCVCGRGGGGGGGGGRGLGAHVVSKHLVLGVLVFKAGLSLFESL